MDFKPARCPSCGGELQVPDEMNSVKCMYCGNEIIVKEAIKAASNIVNLDNILKLADTALNFLNYDEAYHCYNRVLEFDMNNYRALCGRLICYSNKILLNKNLQNIEIVITEFFGHVEEIKKNCPKDIRVDLMKNLFEKIHKNLIKIYLMVKEDFEKDTNLTTYNSFIKRSKVFISFMEKAVEYGTNDKNILEDLIFILRGYTDTYSDNMYGDLIILPDEEFNEAFTKMQHIGAKLRSIDPDYYIVI